MTTETFQKHLRKGLVMIVVTQFQMRKIVQNDSQEINELRAYDECLCRERIESLMGRKINAEVLLKNSMDIFNNISERLDFTLMPIN